MCAHLVSMHSTGLFPLWTPLPWVTPGPSDVKAAKLRILGMFMECPSQKVGGRGRRRKRGIIDSTWALRDFR